MKVKEAYEEIFLEDKIAFSDNFFIDTNVLQNVSLNLRNIKYVFADKKQLSEEEILSIRKMIKKSLTFRSMDELIKKHGPFDQNERQFNKIRIYLFVPNNKKILDNAKVRITNEINHNEKFNFIKDEKNNNIFEAQDPIPYDANNPESILNEIDTVTIKPLSQSIKDKEVNLITVITTSHRSAPLLTNAKKLYFDAKEKLLQNGYPNQFISTRGLLKVLTDEKAKSWHIEKAIMNLLINLYCKAGGVPWAVFHELGTSNIPTISIGIGFSKSQSGYLTGFSVILDEYSRYVKSTSVDFSVPVTGYYVPEDVMREFIITMFKQLRDEYREFLEKYKAFNQFNLAFYKFGIYHREEEKGIRQGLESVREDILRGMEVKYDLISIIKTTYFTKISDDITILNRYTAALRTSRKGYPILFRWQRSKSSFFNNIVDVAHHIYTLTNIHWQTIILKSVRYPATLSFAGKIAELVRGGVHIPSDHFLRKTIWFI